MNLTLPNLKRIAKSAAELAQIAVVFGLLCAVLWRQTAQAADPAQTNMPNKREASAATNELLLNAIRSAPHNATNLATKGATTTECSGSTNLVKLVAANRLTASAAATNLSLTDTTNSAFVLDDKHKLAIGDRLTFRILEDEIDPKALPIPYFVTDSGDLDVPYIGRVPAENKTCRQLAAEIKTALEKDYYYQATVIVAVDVMTKKSPGRVYLVGQVRLPGPVELPTDEVLTLSKAILRGGGFTEYADQRHVKVTRKDTTSKDDKRTFTVDVGEIFDKGKIETDVMLEPGDLIYVPDRLIKF